MADDVTEMVSITIDELHLVGTPAAKVAPLLAKAAGISGAQRREYAKSGIAMPTGAFPIADKAHLKAAVIDLGHYTGTRAKARDHIVARARALNLVRVLPKDWHVKKGSTTMPKGKKLSKQLAAIGSGAWAAFRELEQRVAKAATPAEERLARQQLTTAKMIANEHARERDPRAQQRTRYGLGVPLFTNSHELPPDRDVQYR